MTDETVFLKTTELRKEAVNATELEKGRHGTRSQSFCQTTSSVYGIKHWIVDSKMFLSCSLRNKPWRGDKNAFKSGPKQYYFCNMRKQNLLPTMRARTQNTKTYCTALIPKTSYLFEISLLS